MARSRTARRPALALTLAALTALLAGCLKLDTDLVIDGDTVSGSVTVAVAMDEVAPLGITPEQVFADSDIGLGGLAGVTVEDYAQDRWTGKRYLLDRVDLDELNAASENDPDGLRITRDPQAGTYEFQLVIDLEFVNELDEADLDDPDAPDIDPAQLREGFEVDVAVTFPGEVTEHNGELSGTTVRWQPPAGERSELHAVAGGLTDADPAGTDPAEEDPTAGGPAGTPAGTEDQPEHAGRTTETGRAGWWWLAVAAGAALAIAAVGFLALRRNRPADGDVRP